jgi:hypothetical protein
MRRRFRAAQAEQWLTCDRPLGARAINVGEACRLFSTKLPPLLKPAIHLRLRACKRSCPVTVHHFKDEPLYTVHLFKDAPLFPGSGHAKLLLLANMFHVVIKVELFIRDRRQSDARVTAL